MQLGGKGAGGKEDDMSERDTRVQELTCAASIITETVELTKLSLPLPL